MTYHDPEFTIRAKDRRRAGYGYAGPERRIGERRAPAERERPGLITWLFMALLIGIVLDAVVLHSRYRRACFTKVEQTAQAVRDWSAGVWVGKTG